MIKTRLEEDKQFSGRKTSRWETASQISGSWDETVRGEFPSY